MYKQITPEIFQIEVPLKNNPLRALNAYLVKEGNQNLLIDCGFNDDESASALLGDLREISANMDTLAIFLTHYHSDHAALLTRLAHKNTKIYGGHLNPTDFIAKFYRGIAGEDMELLKKYGFKEEFYDKSRSEFDVAWQKLLPQFTVVGDGDTINIGRLTLEVISTPGHAIPHLCLYERSKNILFCGDHILNKITPNNIAFTVKGNSPLTQYLCSLEKIKPYATGLVLPGHRDIIKNAVPRIEEIKKHHRERLKEIIRALEGQPPKTATEIAAALTWHTGEQSWYDFPPLQKFFSLGETVAHISCLWEKGKILRLDPSATQPQYTFTLLP